MNRLLELEKEINKKKKVNPKKATYTESYSNTTWDKHTNRRVKNLHPNLTRQDVIDFINELESEHGMKVRVTSTFRSFAEQDAEYDKGRTAPGGIVTYAKGGESYHNYGLAFDVVEISPQYGFGKGYDSSRWNTIGTVGKKYGFSWGGDWTSFIDKPHFEKSFGFTTAQLKAKHDSGDFIPGSSFLNLSNTTSSQQSYYDDYTIQSAYEEEIGYAEQYAVDKDKAERLHWFSNEKSRVHSRWIQKGKASTFTKKFNTTIDNKIAEVFGAGYTRTIVLSKIEELENKLKESKSAVPTTGANIGSTPVKTAEIQKELKALKAKLYLANIYNVVDVLDVEHNSIYARTAKKTYCNIYAYDVVAGLGGYIPRLWWSLKTEKSMLSGKTKADDIHPKHKKKYKNFYGDGITSEQNANMLNAWMERVGKNYFGWERENDMKLAQKAANEGYIVIISAANTDSSKSGHINVILPETSSNIGKVVGGKYSPVQSQAGASNFKVKNHSPWWSNSNHTNGAAWIYKGEIDSPIMTDDQLGGAYE